MLTHASTNAASFRYVPGCFTTRRRRRSPMQEYGARRRGVRAVQGVLRGAGAVAGRRGGREPAARGPGRAVANARPGAAASAAQGPPDLWRCGAVSAASTPYCVPIRLVKIGANAATPDRRTPPGGRAGSCGVAGSHSSARRALVSEGLSPAAFQLYCSSVTMSRNCACICTCSFKAALRTRIPTSNSG